MDTLRICPRCHAPLPTSSAEGLCPECLLRQAMASQTLTDPGTGAPIDPPGTSPLSPSTAAGSPRVGENYGGYRIIRLLGKGGMGEVYEADHVESGRRVALKVMSQDLPSADEHKRFLREGRLAASISHPNTVYIYGSEEIAGHPVIAMELVGGGTLKDWVKQKGPLPIAQAVDTILQAIAGLEAAEKGGVLHRDIKPANCFVDRDGTIKVGDFGLSISTLARGESFLTAPGSVLGTPAFASPEQLRGEDLDVRSDIYAVGATLYFLVTGHAPLESQDLVRLIAEVLDRTPELPTKHRPDLPRGLTRVIMRCLEKEGKKRYANYEHVRAALLPFGSNAATAATLGMRFAAGLMDYMVALIPEWACLVYYGTDTFTNLTMNGSLGAGLYWAGAFLWTLLYYAVPEGLWGASAGKGICRLKVVRLTGAVPGIPRAFWRVFVFNFIPWSPYFLRLLTMSTEEARQLVASGHGSATDIVSLALVALLFVTMRRRNGFAAVHDLLSATRVVMRAKAETRPAIATPHTKVPGGLSPTSAGVGATFAQQQVGPYKTSGVLVHWDDREVLQGFDPVLQRIVWIECVPLGTAPVSARRRDLSRPGRLRWLNGKRSADENWDAYEAVSGQALLQSPRQPWTAVRFWLLDLAEELYAGIKHQSGVEGLHLNRVWISHHGRALLLDFPAPGIYEPPVDHADLVVRDIGPDGMQEFLDRVVTVGLASGGPPPPVHVRPFLARLRARKFEAAEMLVANLQSLAAKVASVSRRRRLATILGGLCFLGFLTVFGVSHESNVQHRWDDYWTEHYPGRTSLRQVLGTYETLLDADSPKGDQTNLTTLFEIVLAGQFRDVINDPNFWRQPEAGPVFGNQQRRIARAAVRKRETVGSEELRGAEALVFPTIAAMERSNRQQHLWSGFGIYLALAAMVGALAIASAFAFRLNPVLRLLGLAVVTRDGAPAGRLRLGWRSLVAWLPCLVVAVLAVSIPWSELDRSGSTVLEEAPGLAMAAVLALTACACGLFWSIWKPARAIQDKLAGTYIVPR